MRLRRNCPRFLAGLAVSLLVVACGEPSSTDVGNVPPELSPNFLVVPGGSSLQLRASANAVSQVLASPSTVTDTDTDAQTGTVGPLSVAVDALSASGGGSIRATGDISATWDDPNSGLVIWNAGWVAQSVPGTNGSLALVGGLEPNDGWSYEFTADETGFFTLEFSVVSGGSNTNGLNGFNFEWFVPGEPLPVTDFFPPNSSGEVTQPVVAGITYRVRLTNNSGLFDTGALSDRDASLRGTFRWDIVGRIEVEIDIKPGSDPNSINCTNEAGVIAVAVLTTAEFDAATVDHGTVVFQGARETHRDASSGDARRHEEDVDADGDIDLVFHFRVGETDLTCESTEGTLEGETFDGQTIRGSDAVRMVEGGSS